MLVIVIRCKRLKCAEKLAEAGLVYCTGPQNTRSLHSLCDLSPLPFPLDRWHQQTYDTNLEVLTEDNRNCCVLCTIYVNTVHSYM